MATPKADIATVSGLVVALCCILGGLVLEGGSLRDVTQLTAAIIVLGGTAGAVLVSTPTSVLAGSMNRVRSVLFESGPEMSEMRETIISFAVRARKNGLVSMEDVVGEAGNPFLEKTLGLAIDGADLQEIRKMMELEITLSEERAEAEACVFECAGGYAPTVGIIGAVLGLIQVMKHLDNIEAVGRGIAVAFVATVYGVAIANLILLPVAAKIKARAKQEAQLKELMLDGVCGIVEGLNPKLLRSKLAAFERETRPRAKAREREARIPIGARI